MIGLLLAKRIFSLFLIVLLGFLLVRLRLLRSEDSRVLSVICLNVVTPCAVLLAFQTNAGDAALRPFLFALAAAAVLHAAFIALARLLARPLRLDGVEKACLTYTNCTQLGIPLVTILFGTQWTIYVCAFLAVQLLLFFSHGKALICGETRVDWKAVLLNVNVLAILLSLALYLLRVRLPELAMTALETVSGMLGPAAMLITGMLLGGLELRRILGSRRVWLVAGLRLLLFPLAAVLLLRLSGGAALAAGGGETVMLVLLICASTPAAVALVQMAQIYGRDAGYVSAVYIVTFFGCIVTLPLMTALYQL
ncbi:MAG: AEC family transporter [Oscillospiraceae bacterium]|nr:AEC family transporter [Oscillospiraceae bacterium]